MNFRVCALIILISPSFPCFADDSLYNAGKWAYNQDDYINALKYLFAHKTKECSRPQTTSRCPKELDQAIVHAEQQIREQIRGSCNRACGDKNISVNTTGTASTSISPATKIELPE